MDKISYLCGVDVSKDSFCIAVKNGQFFVKNRVFKMDKDGFTNFANLIKEFQTSLLVGMEATGIYHNNLLNFLQNSSYNTCVVNPYKVKQFFKFSSDKPTKTDKKDAKTIAEFMKLTEVQPQNSLADERYSIRYFVREKERLTQEIAQTKTEIRRLLTLVFPEIERMPSALSKEILSILTKFPSADKIRKTDKDEFIQSRKMRDKGRKIGISLSSVYELAISSISYRYPVYEELLKIKIKRLLELIEERNKLGLIIEKLAMELFGKEIEILTSIQGIGKESAIYFMAEIVDIKRFSGWRKLIGFCGLDPVIKQSGNYKGAFRISKRGNTHARRIIWIMAGCVKRSCPYFREYYLKKRVEGKTYKEAVIATSTKLLRTIYALLNERRCFQ